MNRLRFLGLWMGIFFLGVSPLSARTWTDRLGHSAEGKYIRLFGNQVVIQGAQIIMVPLELLSDEDQAYVLEQVKKEPVRTGGNRGTASSRKSPPKSALREVKEESPEENDPSNPFVTPGKKQPEADAPPPAKGPKYPERIWIDTCGYHLAARFVELRAGKVVLDAEGMELSFPLDVFSPNDLEYIKQVTGQSAATQSNPGGMNPAPSNLYPLPSTSGSSSPSSPGPNYGPAPNPWADRQRAEAAQRDARLRELQRQQQEAEQQRQQEVERQRQQEIERQRQQAEEWKRQQEAERQQAQGLGSPTFPGSQPAWTPPGMPDMTPPPFGPQFEGSKVYICSRCKKVVNSPKLGGKCPHCGAVFMYEKDANGNVVKTVAGTAEPYIAIGAVSVFILCCVAAVVGAVKLINR